MAEDPSLSRRHRELQERFRAQQEARAQSRQDAKTRGEEYRDPKECVGLFWSDLRKSCEGIVEALDRLREDAPQQQKNSKGHGDGDSVTSQGLTRLGTQIQALEKKITDAALYLPPYDVRRAQEEVGILQAKLDTTRTTLAPRKKFSFASRRKLTPMTFLRLENVKDCQVYCGPVAGPVYLESCQGSTIFLASRQLRIHNTMECDLYVHTVSGPIIEDCDGIRFAPFTLSYPDLATHMNEAQLAGSINAWEEVKDFKWLKAHQSPHWSIVPEGERILSQKVRDDEVEGGREAEERGGKDQQQQEEEDDDDEI